MKYPHRRFLVYLISINYNPDEIRAVCEEYRLPPPEADHLTDIYFELGSIPEGIGKDLRSTSRPFRRWLQRQGVYSFWKTKGIGAQAKELLHDVPLRSKLESLALLHSDFETIHGLLGEGAPPPAVLEEYCRYFWDFSGMRPKEKLEALKNYKGRGELAAAQRGDIATAYALSGVRQRVSGIDALDEMISFNVQQHRRMMANADRNFTGSDWMGIAALQRSTVACVEMRQELLGQSGDGVETIRDDLKKFRARTIPSRPIISLDDIEEEEEKVIDVEFSEVKTNAAQ